MTSRLRRSFEPGHKPKFLVIIDESEETHGPEASAYGLCLAPSFEALVLMMLRAGFTRVERIAVPIGGYEQLAAGKRVMVVGYT